MKAFLPIFLCLGATCVASCSSSAPRAPIGLDRRPANTPEVAADPLPTGDYTPTMKLSPAAFVQMGSPHPRLRREERDLGRPINNRHVEIHFNQVDHGQRT